MIAYLDSSVLLRELFAEPERLKSWGNWGLAYSSQITRVEGLRAIDRSRLNNLLDDRQVAIRNQGWEKICQKLDFIEISALILERASASFPTVVRTLDAIHLASALLWQEVNHQGLTFFTH